MTSNFITNNALLRDFSSENLTRYLFYNLNTIILILSLETSRVILEFLLLEIIG